MTWFSRQSWSMRLVAVLFAAVAFAAVMTIGACSDPTTDFKCNTSCPLGSTFSDASPFGIYEVPNASTQSAAENKCKTDPKNMCIANSNGQSFPNRGCTCNPISPAFLHSGVTD
jgi:hypothetical protein